jgi:serine/threonine kinase PknH
VSSPPSDHGSSPDEARFEGDPDADTGPLQVVWTKGAGAWSQDYHAPPPEPAPEFGNATAVAPIPVQESYASRFTTPLTVDPRASKVKSGGGRPVAVLAVVGGLVLVAALGFLLFHLFSGSDGDTKASGGQDTPATAKPEDQQKLVRLLPVGYPAGACTQADLPKGALAKVSCSANADSGGPPSASYTLFPDTSALRSTFDGVVASARQVNCPGNIQSPGPWRRNAAPQVVAGTVFCGFRQDVPTVAWTNDAALVVSSVDGTSTGPSLDQLYAWWSSHS